jgi:hypothetical protein
LNFKKNAQFKNFNILIINIYGLARFGFVGFFQRHLLTRYVAQKLLLEIQIIA